MRAYLKLLKYARGKLHYGFLALVSLLIYNLLNALTLSLIVPFLEILFTGKDAADAAEGSGASLSYVGELKQSLFLWLQGQVLLHGKMNVLYGFAAVMMFGIILKNFFRAVSGWLTMPLETGIYLEIRRQVYEHMTHLSLRFYTHKRKGHLLNLIISDIAVIEDAVMGSVMTLASKPLTMGLLLGAMMLISWKLTLLTLTVLPLSFVIIDRISKSLKKRYDRSRVTIDAFASAVDEFVSGIRIVKNFSAEDYERRKFKGLNDEFARVMISFRRRAELSSPITEVISFFVILLVVIYGGYMILENGSNELKASEFIGFVLLFFAFISPLRSISGGITRVQKVSSSYQRIEELLNEPVDPTEQSEGLQVSTFEHSIELRNVSFGYDEKVVLDNVSLTIQKGESVALVGPSGSGKSTLADLICRFYDPTGGAILFDGKDMRELDSQYLRRLMGVVAQEGILFNDTVRNNIAFGSADKYSLEQVREAATVANADAFIMEMPQQYDTSIGERGTRLSGGQRQRLSIARAVLKNPPIMILDEATSALDTESERLVQSALERIMENRTSIIIAHRLSTITHVDKIVVLEQGKVIETGTHQELLDKQGLYYRLITLQNT